MAHISTKKGLDIPIKGKPHGSVKPLHAAGEASPRDFHPQIALDLNLFDDIKFKVLVKVGDHVKIGQPLVEDREMPGRFFTSPAGGRVREIRRGLKRRLLDIVIDVEEKEEYIQHPSVKPSDLSREELVERLKTGGIFSRIRQRPFNSLANPNKIPRSIFVKALESAPFTPPSELQVAGYEKEFQAGLDALAKLTSGKVNLVFRKGTDCKAFLDAKNVDKHTAEGPHPISSPSLHIQHIDPISSAEDIIWTLNAHDVVSIGHLLLQGRAHIHRVISIAGPGILEEKIGFFKVRESVPIQALVAGRIPHESLRLVSGDVLTGVKVQIEDFLRFSDFAFCAIPENTHRELLHFFRAGSDKYSYSGAYLSGHLNNSHRTYDFTTSQHGETRPFIDGTLYDDVMPINISTINLVKAVMAEDYDLAAFLGLLEIDSEDFALPTFVDPSKIEMMEIIKEGQKRYAADVLK